MSPKSPPRPPEPRRHARAPRDLATLGARIFLARKNKKLTLEKVGAACGVSPQAVGQWEKNDARPTIDRLERLAAVLEMELATLINDPPPPTMAAVADRLEGSQARIAEAVNWRAAARTAMIDQTWELVPCNREPIVGEIRFIRVLLPSPVKPMVLDFVKVIWTGEKWEPI